MALTTLATAPTRFADILRTERKERGLSQRQLAVELAENERGTDEWWMEVERLHRSIRRWESGTIPRGEMMLRLARLLGDLPADFDEEEE